MLAKIGRLDLGELRRLEPDSAIVQELKTLTRDQDALIQTQTHLVNQLTACLKEYYPAALSLFAKVQQRSALVFLQAYPTPQVAQAASMEELMATLRTGKHTNAARVAPKIFAEVQVHRPQLVANQVIVTTLSGMHRFPGMLGPLWVSPSGMPVTQELLPSSSCLQQEYHNAPHGAHGTSELPRRLLKPF